MTSLQEIQDKKEIIIQAARRIFGKAGFHAAKVEDIALEAGVGKGTIYEYFISKKDLFEEMVISSIDFYLRMMRSKVDSSSEAESKLRNFFMAHTEFAETHRDTAKVLLNDPGPMSENLRQRLMEMKDSIIGLVENTVRDAQSNGEFRLVDPNVAALMLASSNWAILGTAAIYGTKIEPKNADTILDIFLKGIKK